MKNIKIFLIAFAFLVLSADAKAQAWWYVGYPYREDVTATLSGNTLTFSGWGDMMDFGGLQPYVNYRDIIQNVIIEDGVTSVGSNAFILFPVLKSVLMSNTVSRIGNAAFADCPSLTSFTMPNSVLSIGDYAFAGCTILTSVHFGNYIATIGERAFWFCPSLTSITIPNSVTTIKEFAFSDCTGLTDVFVGWTVPLDIYGLDVFYGVDVSNVKLHIPTGTLVTYQSTPVWENFNLVEDITAIDNIYAKNLKLYPNPTNYELQITNYVGNGNYAITDLTGKQIINGDLLNGNSINVSSLSAGVYMLKIGEYRGKFVKK